MDQESFDEAVKETVGIAKDIFHIPQREPDLIQEWPKELGDREE